MKFCFFRLINEVLSLVEDVKHTQVNIQVLQLIKLTGSIISQGLDLKEMMSKKKMILKIPIISRLLIIVFIF